MKTPWSWIAISVLMLFLGLAFGHLLSQQYNSWGFTIFASFTCLVAGLAAGAYIEGKQG